MNLLDLFIAIPILWGAYRGYQKGLLLSLVAIVAFGVSLLLSFRFFHIILHGLSSMTGASGTLMSYLAFFLTFAMASYSVNWLARQLRKSIAQTPLSSFDNLLGACLGGGKYAILISMLLWLLSSLDTLKTDTIRHSLLYSKVAPIAPALVKHTSEWMHENSFWTEAKQEFLPELNEINQKTD